MSTTCPRPLRRAWKTAIRSPLAPWIAVQHSASGTVTGSGGRSGKPGRELHAGEGLGDAIVAALARPAARSARTARCAGRRAADCARSRSVRREPGRLETPRTQVLDERVGRGEQPREPRLGRRAPAARPAPSTCRGSPTGSRASPRRGGRGRAAAVGEPSGGSTLITVAPRSASSPPASSPASVSASSTTTTPGERAAAARAPGSRERRLASSIAAHSSPKTRAALR